MGLLLLVSYPQQQWLRGCAFILVFFIYSCFYLRLLFQEHKTGLKQRLVMPVNYIYACTVNPMAFWK